jgi:type I restriction enzyme S subunit
MSSKRREPPPPRRKRQSFSPALVPKLRFPEFRGARRVHRVVSSVDELMTAQARKVGALKTHKMGLMQQLFPREGETQPHLRFPEFKNAGEWKTDTLESLCAAKISYGIVQAGPHVPNGMPYIKSTDLNSELCLAKLARTSDAIALKYRRSEVVPGDIVFSLRGNIGSTQIVPKDIPVANLTQGTARIRPKGSVEFYIQALQCPSIRNRILSVSKGSTFQEISLEALRNVQLLHPESDEQQRIASLLSSLDALITVETQKLEALKTHKNGLMQQLFPTPKEVDA